MSAAAPLLIDDPLDPPSEDEIRLLEREVGAPLPPPFRAFLDRANGGRLDYAFDVPAGERSLRIIFWSLFSTREPLPGLPAQGRFLHELASERALKGVPPGYLPFATDGGASVAYLDLSPEGRGRVVAYIEGLPGWTGAPESAFVELAPDFETFVSRLYFVLEEERPHQE